MADDGDFNNLRFLVYAVHDSIIAAADTAKSMERLAELLAVLLGIALEAFDGRCEPLAYRRVEFAPIVGRFFQKLDLEGAQGLSSSQGIRFPEAFSKRSSAIFAKR